MIDADDRTRKWKSDDGAWMPDSPRHVQSNRLISSTLPPSRVVPSTPIYEDGPVGGCLARSEISPLVLRTDGIIIASRMMLIHWNRYRGPEGSTAKVLPKRKGAWDSGNGQVKPKPLMQPRYRES
ncbi:hypothetical protein BO78DRAFT_158596 [Aspergillus sclerotiicarbonarius CBS 121057]|uniref:Uncharacterized protein n=1 Tax=Aspergillus sclerotiicarbonarius (strain CBS 121057 / IBT 28362) TaxID=1448318 RepID=A0A319EA10_ASPSB|nr:hypothetical protein BO78DRAFT_158596 [Aspergillus sclerotiicarbonarius CBS 121057]